MAKRKQTRRSRKRDPFSGSNSKSMFKDTMNMAGGIIGLSIAAGVAKDILD